MSKKCLIKKPELLLPAKDLEVLKVAYSFGADACYIGGEEFSLRANSANFNNDDLSLAIKYAHNINKKIYITSNIYAHNNNIDDAKDYFLFLNELKPDGVLISDFGLLKLAKEIFKDIDIHISTQANITNYETVNFYSELGIKRVVLARELTLKEINEIRQKCKSMELEVFIHGAMCISYSGRCLLSAFMTNRSANLGLCSHPCRWKYKVDEISCDLIEEKRKDEIYKLVENEQGSFIFNSKDLCMIEHIDDLINANIDVFKIEGRMKNALYVGTMARTYRKAIDDCLENYDLYKNNISWYQNEIKKCTYRQYSTGFYYGYQNDNLQVYTDNTYTSGAIFFGIINSVIDGYAYLEQKNKFQVGDYLEVIRNDYSNIKVKVLKMYDVDTGLEIMSCPHSKQKLKVLFDRELIEGDLLRSYDS